MQTKCNHTIVVNINSCTAEAICADTKIREEKNLWQYWCQHLYTSVTNSL